MTPISQAAAVQIAREEADEASSPCLQRSKQRWELSALFPLSASIEFWRLSLLKEFFFFQAMKASLRSYLGFALVYALISPCHVCCSRRQWSPSARWAPNEPSGASGGGRNPLLGAFVSCNRTSPFGLQSTAQGGCFRGVKLKCTPENVRAYLEVSSSACFALKLLP